MPGLTKNSKRDFDIDDIIDRVCGYLDVPTKMVYRRSREHQYVLARQISMYLIKKKTNMTLKSIGEKFNRDHTSVIHSITSINNYIFTKDEQVINAISNIQSKLLINNN